MNDAPVPPQNLEAEEHVLGAIMLSPAALDAVTDILTPGDFYRDSHGRIYQAALDLHAKAEPVDAITLIDALEAAGDIDRAGGRTRIHEIPTLAPSTANAAHYARIVREKALLRGVIRHGSEATRRGYEGRDEPETIVDWVQQDAYNLTEQTAGLTVDLPGEVRRVYQEILDLDGKPHNLLGAPSGLADLDRTTRGFRKGDLVVVAADTGRGKSALWLNIALHLTITHRRPVAAFSLEMSESELVQRAMSLTAAIPHDRLVRGEIQDEREWARLTKAAGLLSEAPLTLWTDATLRPANLRSKLRQWAQRQDEPALAIVDYLQLLTPDGGGSDNRTSDVSAISRALKVTAMDLQIPILAVSQLRRRLPNTRPHRNDLRESGSIENDASVVILIHHDDNKPGVAELIVAKNRHGAEATVDVQWVGEMMRFRSLATLVKTEAA